MRVDLRGTDLMIGGNAYGPLLPVRIISNITSWCSVLPLPLAPIAPALNCAVSCGPAADAINSPSTKMPNTKAQSSASKVYLIAVMIWKAWSGREGKDILCNKSRSLAVVKGWGGIEISNG